MTRPSLKYYGIGTSVAVDYGECNCGWSGGSYPHEQYCGLEQYFDLGRGKHELAEELADHFNALHQALVERNILKDELELLCTRRATDTPDTTSRTISVNELRGIMRKVFDD